MEPRIAIDTWYQEKNGGEKKEKKEREEKGLGEKSVFEVIESEPSERKARETCERISLFAGFAGQMTIFQKKFCFRSFWVNFGDIWRKLLFNINFKY